MDACILELATDALDAPDDAAHAIVSAHDYVLVHNENNLEVLICRVCEHVSKAWRCYPPEDV